MTLERILAERPSPGQPRTYHFPSFERTVLPSGLQVLAVHVPGRPLVSANLVYPPRLRRRAGRPRGSDGSGSEGDDRRDGALPRRGADRGR